MDIYNIAASLDEYAKKAPYQAAIYFPVGRDKNRAKYAVLSFKQLSELSDRYAHGFADYGIRKGERTLVMMRHSFCSVGAFNQLSISSLWGADIVPSMC